MIEVVEFRQLEQGREAPAFDAVGDTGGSGFDKSEMGRQIPATFSGAAFIASFDDAWKIGSSLIVVAVTIEAHGNPFGSTLI